MVFTSRALPPRLSLGLFLITTKISVSFSFLLCFGFLREEKPCNSCPLPLIYFTYNCGFKVSPFPFTWLCRERRRLPAGPASCETCAILCAVSPPAWRLLCSLLSREALCLEYGLPCAAQIFSFCQQARDVISMQFIFFSLKLCVLSFRVGYTCFLWTIIILPILIISDLLFPWISKKAWNGYNMKTYCKCFLPIYHLLWYVLNWKGSRNFEVI